MICDVCKQNPAKIILKKIVNGYQSEIHLCESCAHKQEATEIGGSLDISDFVKGILDMQHGSNPAPYPNGFGGLKAFGGHFEGPKCPSCGLTLDEFKKTAKLGCDGCYSAFGEILEPIVKRMHGRSVHTGKAARHESGEASDMVREISDIQKQLSKAINEENYELAAVYRDKIKLLKAAEGEGESRQNE
ncbi:MAG: UvrB/UvrC motif-containing protein [Eubacteriaceae bacterium]|jgi:protein arginine kinase activator|nr:UvrB/UvrC motif-containing protein [Eubacteriaceae bacterium]